MPDIATAAPITPAVDDITLTYNKWVMGIDRGMLFQERDRQRRRDHSDSDGDHDQNSDEDAA